MSSIEHTQVFDVEVFVRDLESNEVVKRQSRWIHVRAGQRLELWVDDELKFEEEVFHPRGLSTKVSEDDK